MDARELIPGGYHAARRWTRDGREDHPIKTRRRCEVSPMRYYFIDFEFSTMYVEGPKAALDIGIIGQIKTIPEALTGEPYNPFQMDIYQVGASFSPEHDSQFKVSHLLPVYRFHLSYWFGRTTWDCNCSFHSFASLPQTTLKTDPQRRKPLLN